MGGSSSSSRNENEHSRNDQTPISKQKDSKEILPHNFERIMQDADVELRRSSSGTHLYDQLHEGVFLNNKKKKYWIDKAINNCFVVYARDLAITWSLDGRFWQWISEKDTSRLDEMTIEVAKLENVCWLEVHGKFDIPKLSLNVVYEVSFIVKMEESSYGWEVPVNLLLSLPSGIKQESKVNLMEKPKGQWIHVPVGEFETSSSSKVDGEVMEFMMYEYEGGKWKRGLVIMGVAIKPKQY